MVKLNFAHICDYAFLSQPGKINIIGDFNKIYFEPLSSGGKLFYSFFVVTNFTVPTIGKYIQKIIIKKKLDNLEIFNNNIEREIDRITRIGFIANFGINFPGYGEYVVEVFLDNKPIIDLPLSLLEEKKE